MILLLSLLLAAAQRIGCQPVRDGVTICISRNTLRLRLPPVAVALWHGSPSLRDGDSAAVGPPSLGRFTASEPEVQVAAVRLSESRMSRSLARSPSR
jgi:hypothetical protein